MEAVPPHRPFLLSERLNEQTHAQDQDLATDDLQDSPEIDDDDYRVWEPPVSLNPSLYRSSSLPPTQAPSAGPIRTKSAKNTRKDAKNRSKRRQKRAKDCLEEGASERGLSSHAQQRLFESQSIASNDFSLAADAQIGSGGYTGKKQEFECAHSSISELQAQGLREFVPDPSYVPMPSLLSQTSHP